MNTAAVTVSAKIIDRFGNVSHTVSLDGVEIGEVRKASSGWTAVQGGSYCTKSSRKAAADVLAFWISLKVAR